jgi:hypothetical protein
MAKKKDYGTATHEEILEGISVATELATRIRAMKNPAVRNLIKKLLELINID